MKVKNPSNYNLEQQMCGNLIIFSKQMRLFLALYSKLRVKDHHIVLKSNKLAYKRSIPGNLNPNPLVIGYVVIFT